MAGEILDALVLAARYDEQGLAASGRRVISQVEEVSRASARAVNATGQANPFSGVSRDLITATRDFQRGTLSLEGYNVALQQARSELRAFADQGLQPAKRQISAVNAAIDQTTVSLARQDAATAHVNPGMRRFASSLAVTAASSIGVSSAVGSAAQSILFMSLGMGQALAPIAAVSAAVLIANKVWDVFTKGQREAAEAAKHNTDALKHLQEQQRGPVALAQTSFDTQRKEVERLSRDLADLARQRQAAAAGLGGGRGDVSAAREINLRERQVALTKELTDASELLAVAARSVGEAQAEQVRRGNELVRSLALEAGTFGLTASEARRAAVAMDSELTPAQRAAALASLNHLIQLERQKKAQEDAERAAEAAAKSQAELTARFNAFWDDIEAKANLAGPAIVQRLKEIQDALRKANEEALNRGIQSAFEAAERAANKIKTPGDIAEEQAEKISAQRDAWLQVTDSMAGVVQAAGDVKLIGQEAAQATLDALSLADALKEIALTGGSLTNVLGGIGAGIGLAGSLGGALFGKDAVQLEHERIQQQNTDAIEQNTAAIQAAQTGGGRAAAQQALGSLDPELRRLLEIVARQPVGIDAAKTLDNALQQTGSSLKELQAVAEANGIQLLDSKGRLVAGALDALTEALQQAEEEARHWGDSISEQEAKMRREDKLGIGGRSADPEVAAIERARQIELDALELSAAEEARIAALDLSTKEGRDAFLEWQRDLFRRAEGLTDAERGGFASTEELGGAIETATDAVLGFDDAVSAASKSMQNIPDTFKLASAEWAARAVDITPPTAVSLPSLRGTDFNPRIPGGTDGSQLPQTQVTGNTIVFQVGPLPKNATMEDWARATADEMERRAIASFGLAPAP